MKTNIKPNHDLALKAKSDGNKTKQNNMCLRIPFLAALLLVACARPGLAESYSIQAVPGWNLIANQLDNGDNSLNSVLPLPHTADGTVLMKFDNATQAYQEVSTFFAGFGWFSTSPFEVTLSPGEGAFLSPAGPTPLTLTFTGTRRATEIPATLWPFTLLSRQVPEIGTYETIVGASPVCGSKLYKFNPGEVTPESPLDAYIIYSFDGNSWSPEAPSVAVGEAVWITRDDDNTAPVVACVPTTNPANKNIPQAGNNPASGNNPDGFYQLLAQDGCADANLQIYIKDSAEGPCGGSFVAGPFASGDKVKLTQSPGQSSVKPMAGVILAHINTKGDPILVVTDSSGNQTCHVCFLAPKPK